MPILLNPRHEAFAQHVAAGHGYAAAYAAAGYQGKGPKQSAAALMTRQEIRDRVAEVRIEISNALKASLIRDVNARIDALQDRWERMKTVIAERAVDPAMQDAPGGKTGLLCRTEKSIGSGFDAQIVEEYAVDTGLLKELRAHEEQAARELGQWTEKTEISGSIDIVDRLNAGRDRVARYRAIHLVPVIAPPDGSTGSASS